MDLEALWKGMILGAGPCCLTKIFAGITTGADKFVVGFAMVRSQAIHQIYVALSCLRWIACDSRSGEVSSRTSWHRPRRTRCSILHLQALETTLWSTSFRWMVGTGAWMESAP